MISLHDKSIGDPLPHVFTESSCRVYVTRIPYIAVLYVNISSLYVVMDIICTIIQYFGTHYLNWQSYNFLCRAEISYDFNVCIAALMVKLGSFKLR